MYRLIDNACALLLGVAFLLSSASPSHAQTSTLTIQDGLVYVNGRQLSDDQIPQSLDVDAVNLQLSITGSHPPAFDINGKYYTIENQLLREVQQGDTAVDRTTVVFRSQPLPPNAFMTRRRAYRGEEEAGEALEPMLRKDGQQSKLMQQYVFELKENARQLDELGASLSQRQAQDLINQVRIQTEQAEQFARELPYLQMQAYLYDIEQQDTLLYRRLLNEFELERETQRLAALVLSQPDGKERTLRRTELRELLEHIFELKQENRRSEIEQLETQLTELQRLLAKREAVKNQIVERRLRELIGNAR